MHEASLVQNMFRVIERSFGDRPGTIRKVHVAVGELSGAVPDALEAAFDLYKKDTILADAQLCMERVPIRLKCLVCGREFETVSLPCACPACGSEAVRITDGEDIFIRSLEVAEPGS